MAGRKGRGGRPPELTPEVQAKIVKAITAGAPRRIAAISSGIGEKTLYTWLSRGKRDRKGKYRQFRQAVEAAEADCISRYVAVIKDAAGPRKVRTTKVIRTPEGDRTEVIEKDEIDWGAAAWFLERRTDEFADHRREVKELRKQVAELVDIVRTLERANAALPSANGETALPPGGAARGTIAGSTAPDALPAARGPGPADADHGPDAGPVAGVADTLPGPTDHDALHPPGREKPNRGVPGSGPILDDEPI